MKLQRRKLGSDGLDVSALGLGCMLMSALYGATDEAESIETIHHALDLGVTFFDTAEMYGPQFNEQLLGKALAGKRDQVQIATKFGVYFGADNPRTPDGRPETTRRAHAVHPIAAVQTEYSLWSREPEAEILPTLRDLGVGFVAYSPLGRGFLAGRFDSREEIESGDFRSGIPRFSEGNFGHNKLLLEKVREIAAEKDATPAQLALAWVLAQGDDVVPIPGTERRTYLEQNVGAASLTLTAEDLERIDAEMPDPAGTRYDANGLRSLNR